MGIPSQREATHDVDSDTVRLEQRREKRMQPATQAQSRHAIAVNARGSASICSSVIPKGALTIQATKLNLPVESDGPPLRRESRRVQASPAL
jgi:hypothetical protein